MMEQLSTFCFVGLFLVHIVTCTVGSDHRHMGGSDFYTFNAPNLQPGCRISGQYLAHTYDDCRYLICKQGHQAEEHWCPSGLSVDRHRIHTRIWEQPCSTYSQHCKGKPAWIVSKAADSSGYSEYSVPQQYSTAQYSVGAPNSHADAAQYNPPRYMHGHSQHYQYTGVPVHPTLSPTYRAYVPPQHTEPETQEHLSNVTPFPKYQHNDVPGEQNHLQEVDARKYEAEGIPVSKHHEKVNYSLVTQKPKPHHLRQSLRKNRRRLHQQTKPEHPNGKSRKHSTSKKAVDTRTEKHKSHKNAESDKILKNKRVRNYHQKPRAQKQIRKKLANQPRKIHRKRINKTSKSKVESINKTKIIITPQVKAESTDTILPKLPIVDMVWGLDR